MSFIVYRGHKSGTASKVPTGNNPVGHPANGYFSLDRFIRFIGYPASLENLPSFDPLTLDVHIYITLPTLTLEH